MRTATLFTPGELTEPELARVLEQEFGATWFPDYHRCSIDTEDAFVAVDFDPAYVSQLPPDEERALAAQLGFRPIVALHVSSSTYHSGSPELAERVLLTLCRLLGGRVLVAA